MQVNRPARAVKAGTALFKFLVPETKALEHGKVDAVMSAQRPDRDGDIIHQDGWDLKNFMNHPVLLADHDYHDVRNQIGEWTNLRVEGKGARSKLIGTAQYYVGEGNEKADWAYTLAEKGRAAFSVGFIPRKFELMETEDENRWMPPVEFFEQEMLECSGVTVPAHQDALQLFVKNQNINPELRKIAMAELKDAAREEKMHEHLCVIEDCEEDAISDAFPLCPLHASKLTSALVAKSGRSLSKANESRIKNAVDLLQEVLITLSKPPADDDDDKPDEPDDDEDDKEDNKAVTVGSTKTETRALLESDDAEALLDTEDKAPATCCSDSCMEGDCVKGCAGDEACCAGSKGADDAETKSEEIVASQNEEGPSDEDFVINKDLIKQILASAIDQYVTEEEVVNS